MLTTSNELEAATFTEVKETVEELGAKLLDKNLSGDVRSEAGRTLARMGPESVPAFIKALTNMDRLTRMYGVTFLWLMGSDAKAAVPALTQALKNEKDEDVLFHVRDALARAQEPSAENTVRQKSKSSGSA